MHGVAAGRKIGCVSTQQGRLEQVGPFYEIHQRQSHDADDREC
jgi:hypothetical protein